MLLQHRLDEINSIINGYQVQIEQLQSQIQSLQAHAQKVGSVEAAMESAVSQLQVAINMVNSVCPDELNQFSQVVVSQFEVSADAPQLQAVETIAEVIPDEPTSDAPTPVVDIPSVELEPVADILQPVSEVDDIDNPVLSQVQLEAVSKLRGKGKAFLKAMAVKHRISHNSRTTNDQLISELVGKVTRQDVAEYTAQHSS